MRFRKEDLPKIIGLSLVLVAAVIWAVVANVRTIQRYSGARAPAATAGGTETGTPGQQAAGTQTGAPPAMWAGLLTPVPPPSRDPFDPVIAPRWQRERSTPAPQPSSTTPSPLPAPPPLPGSAAGDKGALQLIGIIVGQPTIVVMRRGDQPFFVRQGEYVEGELRVTNVTRDSVTLRDRQGSYTFRLGG